MCNWVYLQWRISIWNYSHRTQIKFLNYFLRSEILLNKVLIITKARQFKRWRRNLANWFENPWWGQLCTQFISGKRIRWSYFSALSVGTSWKHLRHDAMSSSKEICLYSFVISTIFFSRLYEIKTNCNHYCFEFLKTFRRVDPNTFTVNVHRVLVFF